jgi:SAM-dependent MidA family methyltransferase
MPNSPAWDPVALEIEHRLTQVIRSEIAAAHGLLPFDRFMELALYAPGLGYYAAGSAKLGAAGDFVTAPELSPLFGGCLAIQCAEALGRLGGGDILELGAGSGSLAVDVLQGLEGLGALPDRYLILEPSPDLRERQQRLLAERLPAELAGLCRWLDRLPERLRGAVLANEVLDAMPIHRFCIGPGGETLEIYVCERDGVLVETAAPPRSPGLAEAVAALQCAGLALTAGYRSEINLRLSPWLRAIGESLDAGLLLLIDYGYPAAAYYQPDRSMGTLMCHLRHRAHSDPYRHLGLQDITAHVDFSAAAHAGIESGFELAGFAPQAQFLIGCGIARLMTPGPGCETPDPSLLLGAKQLLLPNAMGERFKALGLAKGVAGPWCGFSVRDLCDRL